jgi:hypothetical protein
MTIVPPLVGKIKPVVTLRRTHPGIFYGLFVLPTIVWLLTIGILGYLFLQQALQRPYNPLYFPTQHVAISPVRVGQSVGVKAIRCNKANTTVTYTADKAWVSIVPAGTIIYVGESQSTEAPGCISSDSVNPMPSDVVSKTSGWLSQKNPDGSLVYPNGVQWEIKATDKALGHSRSKNVVWATTPITVTK